MITPFAVNLRKRASALNLSNAEVARRAGLSERRYGNYATGRTEPDLATLVRISEVLNTSVDTLLSGEIGEQPSAAEMLVHRLLAAAKVLKKSDLELVVLQVEALANSKAR